ncbi:MAG TPA: ABC transporter permease [Pyrinomonadaceae bacterium]|jgi:ABC-2 type transport system permease protein|nr:ABC transporter permease [Pyrinomonadaceae bacterium]
MKKFFAVVRREYVQRVRTKFFVIATILGPLLTVGFTVVPGLMIGMKTGGPSRIAIIDQTGNMYERVASEINDDEERPKPQPTTPTMPQPGPAGTKDRARQTAKLVKADYAIEKVDLQGRSLQEVINNLDARVSSHDLDGYLILPPDLLKGGQPEFHARNTADLITSEQLQRSISQAVRSQRLVNNGIDEKKLDELSKPIRLKSTGAAGEESKGEAGFFLVFGAAMLIYMSVLLYGQVVLGAVIEEKETRIAEILFSSMRSFPLMIGKLIGVSLVALTQLGIWAVTFAAVSVWAAGSSLSMPHISPFIFVWFAIFFLMGFFIYATVYAVVGSMVTTTQEGGQLAMPVVLFLIAALFVSFNIIRSPNSPLAFWASMFPFFAPITMLVRIVTETPPLWQILLSLGLGFATATGLIWLASRIYRVGMLMYGKKATIPEVMRWVRQS